MDAPGEVSGLADEHDLGLPRNRPFTPSIDYIEAFLASKRIGTSPHTYKFYRRALVRARAISVPGVSPFALNDYLRHVPGNPGNRQAHYRTLRTFFRWLYSPRAGFGLRPEENPLAYVDAPAVEKRIMPALDREQVSFLIEAAETLRDKAIIALFVESGLRVSELVAIDSRKFSNTKARPTGTIRKPLTSTRWKVLSRILIGRCG